VHLHGMRRREIVALLGGAVAWPLPLRAQQGERMRRVGVLMGRRAGDAEGQKQAAALQRGPEELHWSSPRNIEIEYRWPAGDAGDRIDQRWVGRGIRNPCSRVPQRSQGIRLCRRSKRDGRLPLVGWPLRSYAGAHRRPYPSRGGCNCHPRHYAGRARASRAVRFPAFPSGKRLGSPWRGCPNRSWGFPARNV
jgi:hypothetical protein